MTALCWRRRRCSRPQTEACPPQSLWSCAGGWRPGWSRCAIWRRASRPVQVSHIHSHPIQIAQNYQLCIIIISIISISIYLFILLALTFNLSSLQTTWTAFRWRWVGCWRSCTVLMKRSFLGSSKAARQAQRTISNVFVCSQSYADQCAASSLCAHQVTQSMIFVFFFFFSLSVFKLRAPGSPDCEQQRSF